MDFLRAFFKCSSRNPHPVQNTNMNLTKFKSIIVLTFQFIIFNETFKMFVLCHISFCVLKCTKSTAVYHWKGHFDKNVKMNYISHVLKNFRRYHSFFRATIYVSRVSHTINDFAIVRPCENGFKSPRFNQFNCFQMILIAWVGELVQIRISSYAMGVP